MDSIISLAAHSGLISSWYGHIATVRPGWTYHDHHHAGFELLVCLDGEAVEWVRDRNLPFRRGDCLLIKPDVRHSTANSSASPLRYFSLAFEIDDLPLRDRLLAVTAIHVADDDASSSRMHVHLEQMLSILHRNDVAGAPFRKRLPLSDALAFLSCLLLLIRDWLELPSGDSARGSEPHSGASPYEIELAHEVARELEAAEHSRVRVAGLARSKHTSRGRLSQAFAAVYGMSPRQYMTQLQIKKAKELLLHTSLSVEKVAAELGFSSVQHFSRQFRRWTDSSPLGFRKQFKTNG